MLFLKAFFSLLAYDVIVALGGFNKIYRVARSWSVQPNVPSPDVIERICTAVNYICVWYPKQALCLQRAFVTTYLLRTYGVPAELVLGAQKLPFKAHAWVEVHGRAINERSNVQSTYAVWERC